MGVRIRLKRIGKNPRKRPHFRVCVSEQSGSRDGRSIEEIGIYNPVDGSVKLDLDKYKKWVKNGAQPSQTVKNLAKKAAKPS